MGKISREPGTDVQRNLPNYEDPQQRLLAATYPSPDGPVRVICAYCPNGQSLESEKYTYKLEWLAALRDTARGWLTDDPKAQIALVGDWNIAPTDDDLPVEAMHYTIADHYRELDEQIPVEDRLPGMPGAGSP